MSAETTAGTEQQSVSYWTPPGETDTTAFTALFLLFAIVFAVLHLYARFDRYVEHHNEGTPLKTTIPTLLMIAFAYEIFPPLSHFSILLPLALIATAMARDFMLWFEPRKEHMLKGELEDVLLDELHHHHLGEHDHEGRRGAAAVDSAPIEEMRAREAAEAKAKTAADAKVIGKGEETVDETTDQGAKSKPKVKPGSNKGESSSD